MDLEVVDVLTVHQAKGLEWPVVFVPCMVDRRFPSQYAGDEQDWLLSERIFPKTARRRYDGSDVDERRLFYVAMTRAKDMLYLSCAQRKKNRLNPSPYLEEVAGGSPPAGPILLPAQYKPDEGGAEDKPTLSFSELAAYESCPLGYRLRKCVRSDPIADE